MRFYWLRLTVLSAVFFFSWGQIFSTLLASGLVWSVTESRLSSRDDYALQTKLFQANTTKHYDAVIFGDSGFSESLRFALHGRAILDLSLPKVRLSDVQDIVDVIKGLSFDFLILQDAPHFWTNVSPTAPEQNIDQWRLHRSGPLVLVTNRAVRTFWQTLDDWAVGGSAATLDNSSPYFIESLRNAKFQFPPTRDRSAIKVILSQPASLRSKMLWIADLSRLPPDTPANLIADFETALRDKHTLGQLGKHVSYSEAAAILAD